jgi:hypothetical protein
MFADAPMTNDSAKTYIQSFLPNFTITVYLLLTCLGIAQALILV